MGRGVCRFCYLFFVVLVSCALNGAVTGHQIGTELRDFVTDFSAINFNLFSKESLLVAGIGAELYAAAHIVDDSVHNFLYDSSCHTNTYSIGCLRSCFAEDLGIALPLLGISVGLWCSRDYHTRLVGRDLLAGMVGIGIVKMMLKECLYEDCCYRPYSGCFTKKRVFGGFPSGHAAVLAYATVLLGLQKGPKWAIGMGAYGAVVVGSALICNYHYLSQVVAGATLGALYAVAADRLINQRMNDWLEMEVAVGQRGNPLLTVTYSF